MKHRNLANNFKVVECSGLHCSTQIPGARECGLCDRCAQERGCSCQKLKVHKVRRSTPAKVNKDETESRNLVHGLC